MKKLLATLTILTLALPAGATPVSYDNAFTEALGERCEAGVTEACQDLVALTEGNCSGPANSGCRYSLEIVNPSEPMVLVPNLEFLGYSRISTVEHCAELTQTEDWSNMITDEDLVLMESCLIEHT